jgi:preprotein translocase subunit SecF
MRIIAHRRLYYIFSGVLIAGSVVALLSFGLRFGIDFTGGSLLEARFPDGAPEQRTVSEKLTPLTESLSIQQSGSDILVLRFRDVTEERHQEILTALREIAPNVEELRFDSLGPTIGRELERRGILAIALGLLAIMFYIAWAFRGSSRRVPSWQYGTITAAVALFHDVLIPLGAFAVLGKVRGVEVNTPFIAAILTVLGYSVHDTIVVFDRVRENVRRFAGDPFPEIVERAVRQTLGRSLNTSLTVLFAIAAVWHFGGVAIEAFAVTLFLGVVFGTYSSIFIAPPVLVTIQEWLRQRRR